MQPIMKTPGRSAIDAVASFVGSYSVALFMITVSNTLDMMGRWTFFMVYFGNYISGDCQYRSPVTLNEGLNVAENFESMTDNIKVAFKDRLRMTCTVVSSIMSIGFLGILLALFTPVSNWAGFIFHPFTALMQIPEALLTAQTIGHLYCGDVPALCVCHRLLATRYVIAVGCIFAAVLLRRNSLHPVHGNPALPH